MSNADLLVVLILGSLFILIGAGIFLWGRGEEKNYYKAISTRNDVREYIEHTPERPEPGGLKIGGFIAMFLGLFLLILDFAFWLTQ
ncbi:MAG: hypothetical protein JSV32_03955 [Dehalococcoidia bacterium]|nr:MAG: hypothetical protein JSV32_03955 [Dehalococcoidia bacterium]